MGEDFPEQPTGFREGFLLAGYRLEAPVGAGGMAVVFRARDERLGRLVALKILAPAVAADPAFRRRFIAESRAAAAVDDPHIIPVYEAGEADGVLFIAMRFVQGGDLRLVLQREGALAPGRAAAFISPVASALDAAHAVGLVHRDVKPANILVDAHPGRPDHVYLSDFGVTKGAMTSVSLTEAGQFLGTPDYSAPEQIDGRTVDGRTDQYALACVSYQLLTGAPPFERDQGMAVLLAHLSQPPPSLGSRRPGLPEAADRVLARALAKAPEKRFGSCRDFAEALREALGLAPYIYISGGSASVPGHPQTEITSQPEFPGAAGVRKAAVPAGLEAAATMDPVPGGALADAVDVPPAAVILTGPAHPATHPDALSPTARAVAGDGVPADAATATVDSKSAGEPGTPGGSGKLAGELGQTTTDAVGPASTADVQSVGQSGRYYQGSGNGARPARRARRATVWIRRHRLAAIGMAGAVLAVAIVVPYVLASSPSLAGSPSSVNSPGSSRRTLVDLPTSDVTSVAFSPDGGTLAVGGKNGRTYLWNIAAGKRTGALTDLGSRGVNAVAFSASPDGVILATADSNGHTYLWNIAAGKLTGALTDPGSRGVNAVAFIPDSVYLIAADSNGHDYFWNIATRKLTTTSNLIENGAAAVPLSVAVSPDGNTQTTTVTNSYGVEITNIYAGTVISLTDPGSSTGVTTAAAYSQIARYWPAATATAAPTSGISVTERPAS